MYSTLADLVNAYHDHSLTAPLTVDNDSTFVYANTDGDEPGDDDNTGVDCVFEMHPAELLEACLDLLGIPHEHV
jgi:hypothetical protein